MAFSIDKVTVTAQTRKLKAEYTIELAQDLKAVHGLDAETELANILSAEILAEINREIIRTIYFSVSQGREQQHGNSGRVRPRHDSDGRWLVERFKGLFFQIEREANAIAKNTRRGKGNIILCSSDVASAFAAAEILDYTPAYNAALTVDDTGATFAGTLQGRYKVYIDPYAPQADVQYFVCGFRGASPYDAGLVLLSVCAAPDAPRTGPEQLPAEDWIPDPLRRRRQSVLNAAGNSDGTVVFGTNEYYRKVRVLNLM
jgi:hypothetical protein